MRVLVLGATGFIGSVVAERLGEHGHEVVALVRPDASSAGLPPGATVRAGDLADPASLTAAVTPDVDGVIHLANPTGDQGIDTAANEALLSALRGTGKAYIYTSGVWVLGATGPAPADEDTPTNPIAIVSYRPSIERRVLDAAGDGVRSVVIRPGIVHGRGGGVPALLVGKAAQHGVGRYVGDGSARYPMVHIDDIADLFVAALERAEAGSLFHAVADQGVPVVELALAAATAAGVEPRTESWPVDEVSAEVGPLFAEALSLALVCSGERARRVLGWEPSRPDALNDVAHGSYGNAPVAT